MARRPDNSLSASQTVVIGSTGSGKSSFVLRHRITPREKRIIVWDGKDEYDDNGLGFTRVTSYRQLAEAVRAQRARIAFVGGKKDFPYWCKAVWAWGHCLAIAEELSIVTTPAKAPDDWLRCVNMGRGHGIRLISTTQRPQEIDKTVLGNPTDVWCGFMSRAPDRKYMADSFGVDAGELGQLGPGDYMYWTLPAGAIKRGNVHAERGDKTRKTGGKRAAKRA